MTKAKNELDPQTFKVIQCADRLIRPGPHAVADVQVDCIDRVIWIGSHVERWRWPRAIEHAIAHARPIIAAWEKAARKQNQTRRKKGAPTMSVKTKKLDRIPPATRNAQSRMLMRLAARLTGPYDELLTLEMQSAATDAKVFGDLAEAVRDVHRKLFKLAGEAELLDAD